MENKYVVEGKSKEDFKQRIDQFAEITMGNCCMAQGTCQWGLLLLLCNFLVIEAKHLQLSPSPPAPPAVRLEEEVLAIHPSYQSAMLQANQVST